MICSGTTSTSLPADLLLSLALSKSLLALSLHIARDWLLAQGFSAWALSGVVLSVGAAGLAVWERIWEQPKGYSKRREVSWRSTTRGDAQWPVLILSVLQERLSPFYPVVYAMEVLLGLLALSRFSVLR